MQNDRVIVLGSGLSVAAAARAVITAGRAVTVIEEREPVSTPAIGDAEWYSAWSPGGDEAIGRLATAGIDRLEAIHLESGGAFHCNRRGQLFVTRRPDVAKLLRNAAGGQAAAGGGPLREHTGAEWYLPAPAEGFRGVPNGFDLFEGGTLRLIFPFVSTDAVLGLEVRRAGWIDARALRRWLLTTIRALGGAVMPDAITSIECQGDAKWIVTVASGVRVEGSALVLAGPKARTLLRRAGLELSWFDGSRVIGHLDRGERLLDPVAPLVVSVETVTGEWGSELGFGLPLLLQADDGGLRLESLAGGPIRPDQVMALGELMLRQLSAIVPALSTKRGPPGSYSVTSAPLSLPSDLRPMIGMVDRRGCYLMTGLGPGVSFLFAAADILGAYLGGHPLPQIAPAFAPARLVTAPSRVLPG